MEKFVIISDSSMDITKETRLEYGIEYPVCGKIIFSDGRMEDSDAEWEKYTPEQYFTEEVKKGIKTSLPNQYEIVTQLEQYFKNGQDILAIVLSTGISGTYSAFVKAGEELMEKYPDRKMLVVDSLRYSSGVGLLDLYASELRAAGKSLEETYEWVNNARLAVHQCGVLDDLKFLARNGKITGFKAFMGTMVGVKPIADFSNQTGQPFPLGNVRGYKRAYKMIAEYVKATIGDASDKIVVVEHSLREEQALELQKIVKEQIKPRKVVMARCGMTNGSAIGPGLATVFYVGDKPLSENLVEESKLFKDISATL